MHSAAQLITFNDLHRDEARSIFRDRIRCVLLQDMVSKLK